MEQLNKIELRGTVGSVRVQTVGDRKVAHINLATNYAYRDRNGGAVIDTTWHTITAWENGDRIQNLDYIEKGGKLYVIGRLSTRKYTGIDDVERTIYEVQATRLQCISSDEPLSCEMS